MDPICKPFIINLGDIAPLRGALIRGVFIRGRRLFNILLLKGGRLLEGGVKKKGAFIRGFTVLNFTQKKISRMLNIDNCI